MKQLIFILVWLCLTPALNAKEVRIAVAANFAEAAKEIGEAFAERTKHNALFSFGSTGQLYTQISQYAPFEVFLAADQERPEKTIRDGLGVAGSRFTYASGKIVLFSIDKTLVNNENTLKDSDFTKIAIANPVTAPYGVAAIEIMEQLELYNHLKSKIVHGNNIAQTYQFVHTQNAELGFIALSQVIKNQTGSRWIVPEELYSRIAQDAVLLKSGADNPAAHAFLKFLKGPEAAGIINKYGYGSGGNEKT
tara:strand:+ start:159998 stop:160747 length:750 start_codon:yes stop_codon:yes gene_type:complete